MTFILTDVGPPNAQIVVHGPLKLVKPYARGDFQLQRIEYTPKETCEKFDYAVICSRLNKDLNYFLRQRW